MVGVEFGYWWRYCLLAYSGRLRATRGMNRSSTIVRMRSGGIG
jgi:hypothetical protein